MSQMTKTHRKERIIAELDVSKGLMLGYFYNEQEMPEGHTSILKNLYFNRDTSLSLRPSFHTFGDGCQIAPIGEDPPSIRPVQMYFPLTSNLYIVRFADSNAPLRGIYAHSLMDNANDPGWLFDSPVLATFDVVGTQTIPPVNAPTNAINSVFSLGAQWSNHVVAGFFSPATTFETSSIRASRVDIPRAFSSPVQVVCYRDDQEANNCQVFNLFDINGHVIQAESLSFDYSDLSAFHSFARIVTLAHKNRIFCIAGNRLSYTAIGNPRQWTAAGGGGFLQLDTQSQIVGAFILQDVMYIATRQELFTLTFEADPGRDGTIRRIAKLEARGAAEYDGVGYIAVEHGMYQIVNGQLVETFVPSLNPGTSYDFFTDQITRGDGRTTSENIDTTVSVPLHCSISKIGSNIILGGVGDSLTLHDLPSINTFIYNIDVDAWSTWEDDPGEFSPLRTTTPLIRINLGGIHGSGVYWGSGAHGRQEPMSERLRSAIVLQAKDVLTGTGTSRFYPRPVDSHSVQSSTTGAYTPMSEWFSYSGRVFFGYHHFGAPLSQKRLHRLWVQAFDIPTGTTVDDVESRLTTRVAFISTPQEYYGPFTDFNVLQVGAWGQFDNTDELPGVDDVRGRPGRDRSENSIRQIGLAEGRYMLVNGSRQIFVQGGQVRFELLGVLLQMRSLNFDVRYFDFISGDYSIDDELDFETRYFNMTLGHVFVDMTILGETNTLG